MANKAATLAKE
jgi:hypothetical protein